MAGSGAAGEESGGISSAAGQEAPPPGSRPSRHSSSHAKDQAARLGAWLSNMRLFRLFNNERLMATKHKPSRLYSVKLKDLTP